MSRVVGFIDLTTPVTQLRDEIINLDSDESFDTSVVEVTNAPLAKVNTRNTVIRHSSSSSKNTKTQNKVKDSTLKKLPREKTTKNVAECPICWDELGKNPLVSTVCGHVFCRICLEQSLSMEKKCPTCRHRLYGKMSYHPLFLNI